MHIQRSLLLAAVLALHVGPVLAQGNAEVQQRRQEIDTNAQTVLDDLMKAQAPVRDLYSRAVGYAVFTVARGSSAAVAEPYEPPDAPEGTDGAGVVVVAESITLTVMERTTVSAYA